MAITKNNELNSEHIEDCELGDNWLSCPACVEAHNSICSVKDIVHEPTAQGENK